MMGRAQTAAVRGAGLGFLLCSIIFVLTWSPLALVAIPAGALAGLALGQRLGLEQPSAPRPAASAADLREGAAARWLAHPRLAVRFACLVGLGSLLFLLAWAAGYYLLPEGALRAGAQAQLDAAGLGGAAESAFSEGLRIFRYNLFPFALIVLANLLVRANGIPLGYVIPLYNIVLYGLFVGSNSFAIPYPERMAPSFAILSRAGPYEMLAFLLAAAASAPWSYYQVRRLFLSAPEPAAGLRAARAGAFAALVLALALLAAAAFIEGAMIIAR